MYYNCIKSGGVKGIRRPVIKIHPILYLIVDYYESTIEASRCQNNVYNIRSTIMNCCSNPNVHHAGGFIYRYLDEFTNDYESFFEKAKFLKNGNFNIIESIKLGAFLWGNYNYFKVPNYRLFEFINGEKIYEEWRTVPNTENLYKVSTFGRLLSYHKYPYIYLHNFDDQLTVDYNDYINTTIHLKDKSFSCRIHQLVAKTFIPNPLNLTSINHKNEIKNDNRVVNLEWCDQRYNNMYNDRHLKVALKKSKSVNKIDKETGTIIKRYNSIKDAAIEHNVNSVAISNAASGRSISSANFKWSFC